MKRKVYFTMIGITLLAGAGIFWKYDDEILSVIASTEEETKEDDLPESTIVILNSDQIKEFGIETKLAGSGQLAIGLSTRGKIIIHPDKLVHILPKVSGVAKETIKNIGNRVKEGEILAVMESREMADIKANYLAAKEKATLAQTLFEREKLLYEKKVSSEQDYLHAKSAYEEAKINIQLSKQKLHAFGITDKEIQGLLNENGPELRLYEIRSPMDGVVIARHMTQGEFIEDTTTIFEIADLNTVWIEIGIYPKDLAKVKEGQIVDVSLPTDGKSAQAKIIYISPIIQDETITARAIAEMKNTQGNWRPGSYVKVNITTDNVLAPIVISKEAFQDIDGKQYVFVRTPEGFEKRQVKFGNNDNETIEILSGLEVAEEYASTNTFLLKADINKSEAGEDD